MTTEIDRIIKESDDFHEAVNNKEVDDSRRVEVRNTLRMIFRQVGSMSGKDLELLKRHLDKVVNF